VLFFVAALIAGIYTAQWLLRLRQKGAASPQPAQK